MIRETYLGSWAGPSRDRRRNSQELPSLCTHSSNVVTGSFPEKKDAAEGLAGRASEVCRDGRQGQSTGLRKPGRRVGRGLGRSGNGRVT